jgi:hypothetical protein
MDGGKERYHLGRADGSLLNTSAQSNRLPLLLLQRRQEQAEVPMSRVRRK